MPEHAEPCRDAGGQYLDGRPDKHIASALLAPRTITGWPLARACLLACRLVSLAALGRAALLARRKWPTAARSSRTPRTPGASRGWTVADRGDVNARLSGMMLALLVEDLTDAGWLCSYNGRGLPWKAGLVIDGLAASGSASRVVRRRL